jgi:hypothetical protein
MITNQQTITATTTINAVCTGTKKVLGGAATNTNATNYTIATNFPSANGTWSATFNKGSGGPTVSTVATVYAICANTN